MFPKDWLTYMYKHTRTYFFITTLIFNLIFFVVILNDFPKNPVWFNIVLSFALLFWLAYFIDNCFFLLGRGNVAKRTREERAMVYGEGYKQGRFDEDIERTYGYGVYEKKGEA